MAATIIGQGITIEGEVTSEDEVVVGGIVYFGMRRRQPQKSTE